jgi:hypothetical protein
LRPIFFWLQGKVTRSKPDSGRLGTRSTCSSQKKPQNVEFGVKLPSY